MLYISWPRYEFTLDVLDANTAVPCELSMRFQSSVSYNEWTSLINNVEVLVKAYPKLAVAIRRTKSFSLLSSKSFSKITSPKSPKSPLSPGA